MAHTAEQEQAIRFLLLLAESLHRFGTPAFRLEEALAAAAERLGVTARFFSSPTAIYAAFGPVEEQRTTLLRVEPGEVDLGRLAQLYAVAEDVQAGRIGAAAGSARLAGALAAPPVYPPGATVVAFGLASAGAAVLLGGGGSELAVAAAIGTLIGLLAWGASASAQLGRIFALLAALAAAFAAGAAARVVEVAPALATVAGLIVLVPGFSLTIALNEIATGHLSSGTARLTGAAVVFLEIIFGVAVGQKLALGLGEPQALAVAAPFPAFAVPLALLATVPGLLVLLRAPLRVLPYALGVGLLALYGARAGSSWLGPGLGGCTGAFLVAAASNLYARWRRQPASMLFVPGLLILVPGSLGLSSLSALLEQETIAGIDTAFRMVLVAISIVAGVLVANALVPPQRSL